MEIFNAVITVSNFIPEIIERVHSQAFVTHFDE